MLTRKLIFTTASMIIALVAALALRSSQILESFGQNRLALAASQQVLASEPTTRPPGGAGPHIPGDECRAFWFEGFIAQANDDLHGRETAWRQAIQCDPGLVVYLHALFPEDQDMASLALQAQPASAEAWFWAGDLQPENRLESYMRGLELDPHDGLRWLALGGMLYKENQLYAAMQAFLQACLNGDPGANGCYGAGNIARQLGDPEAAIRYYRLSKWEEALALADQLEQQLLQQGAP